LLVFMANSLIRIKRIKVKLARSIRRLGEDFTKLINQLLFKLHVSAIDHRGLEQISKLTPHTYVCKSGGELSMQFANPARLLI